MDLINHWASNINSILWGVFFLIPLLCGTGLFYTIKLRFPQVRLFALHFATSLERLLCSVKEPTSPG